VSRFFAPGSGIPEDPTTGGLHCSVAPLFAEKLARPRLAFHQAYPGRGGDLVCEARGDRVLIEGQAVTVAESRLRIDLLGAAQAAAASAGSASTRLIDS
jgi:predicted PhzF superfamily epimerase YddE/YHI9